MNSAHQTLPGSFKIEFDVIDTLKICNSSAMHLGKKFLAANFTAILYSDSHSIGRKSRASSPIQYTLQAVLLHIIHLQT